MSLTLGVATAKGKHRAAFPVISFPKVKQPKQLLLSFSGYNDLSGFGRTTATQGIFSSNTSFVAPNRKVQDWKN